MIDGKPPLGSATHGPSIYDLRAPWGGPRFHPSDEHPATFRMREQRRKIVELLNANPMMVFTAAEAYKNGCEALAYLDQRLAEFEAGELEAKRREWFYIRDRAAETRQRRTG